MITHLGARNDDESMMWHSRLTEPAVPVAVRIRGLTKHFGSGEQRVQALRGHRLGCLRRSDDLDRRSVGLRQDDAACR